MRHRDLAVLSLSLALAAPLHAQDCSATSVGITPLNDLAGGTYQGAEGGLYPGGGNAIPPGHLSAGLAEAAQVVPRDAAGAPDPNGKIGFLSIGMSNTRLHFADFTSKAGADPERDARVVVLNTAQGGVPAEDMDDPDDPYWNFVAQGVDQAGLSPAQVQVVWMLQANRQPTAPFPDHALGLRDQMAAILRIVRDEYPNARLAFLGSRIYAGYAVTTLNPEPWSYEQSFSNKWLIEAQMSGQPELNFDPDTGPVEAPWIAWGPYMWADGLVPRSDGLIWECQDFNADGTHPSPSGTNKVGTALLGFVHSEPVANVWYLGDSTPCEVHFCNPADGSANNVASIVINSGCTLSPNTKVGLTGGPAGQFCYLLIGDGTSVVHQPPGSAGDLCVTGGSCLGRYAQDIGQINGGGNFITPLFDSLSGGAGFGIPTCGGQLAAGQSWTFQYWHRQPMGAPSTFSEALRVTFQ